MTTGLYLLFLLAVPFLFAGLIRRIKALWSGRKGPPLLQPLYDTVRLLRKEEVISGTTSWIFRIGGAAYLASVLTAALIFSFPGFRGILSFPGDFVVFACLLGFGRFLLVLSAMDTGSSFEGMGASREATFAAIAEPAFFLMMGSLALFTGETSLQPILSALDASTPYTPVVKGLSVFILFIMILVEGSRVPVDDPDTHLELTMIHEVMVLDHSGPNLAYVLYAVHLKMLLFALLIAHLLVPVTFPPAAAVALTAGVLIACASGVGLIESWMARLRMSHNPQFIFIMTAVSLILIAAVLYFIEGGR